MKEADPGVDSAPFYIIVSCNFYLTGGALLSDHSITHQTGIQHHQANKRYK